MKNKKQMMLVLLILLVIVGTFAFKNYKKASKVNEVKLSLSDLRQQNFSNEQLAVLYASSTTEVLQKGKGNSLVIFIDHQGNSHSLELSGLESGSTSSNTEDIFIEESNRVMVLGNEFKKYEMPTEELRGIQTGYLSKTKQFYSLYNTGFSKKDDYVSTLRYSKNKKIQSTHIPYFISTAGQLSDRIVILTQDLISGEFALQEVKLASKIVIQKILDLPLQDSGELDSISPVVADSKNFYFVMTHYQTEKHEDLELVIINRSTKKVKTIPFIQYRTEHQVENALPFNFNHSAYVNKGNFYYVNGLGEVYQYNILSGDIKKKIQFSIGKNSRFEQVTFKNNQIHHIYSNKEKQFFLETFDLTSSKKKKTIEIQNLSSVLPMDDKNYLLTNIEILE